MFNTSIYSVVFQETGDKISSWLVCSWQIWTFLSPTSSSYRLSSQKVVNKKILSPILSHQHRVKKSVPYPGDLSSEYMTPWNPFIYINYIIFLNFLLRCPFVAVKTFRISVQSYLSRLFSKPMPLSANFCFANWSMLKLHVIVRHVGTCSDKETGQFLDLSNTTEIYSDTNLMQLLRKILNRCYF